MIKVKERPKKVVEEEEKLPPKDRPIMLTFTELYSKKQEGLEELLYQGYQVYLVSKRGIPIKLTLASLS